MSIKVWFLRCILGPRGDSETAGLHDCNEYDDQCDPDDSSLWFDVCDLDSVTSIDQFKPELCLLADGDKLKSGGISLCRFALRAVGALDCHRKQWSNPFYLVVYCF